MQKQLVVSKTMRFPTDENYYYYKLFRDRFARTDEKKPKFSPELLDHSIRVAKKTHEMTRCLPLAVEGVFHAFDLKEVLEKCPELTGLINPHQFRAYKLLKQWEMNADYKNPKSIAEFLNFLYRFPLAVVLRVLDMEDIANNEPSERIKIYKCLGETDTSEILSKTTEAIDALYIPIARRLGWEDVRWKLRDVSLSVHYPQLREKIFGWYTKQERKLEELSSFLSETIPTSSSVVEKTVRKKTRESLFRKLVKKSGKTDEGCLLRQYQNAEDIIKESPDLVAAQCILRRGGRETLFYVKNLLIPRLKRERFEIEKAPDGEEFEVKKFGEAIELIHVIAKPPKKFGPFPIEIQIMTQEVNNEMKDGEFAHERYKGGKLDGPTMKKIEKIGQAIRQWEPEDEIIRRLVYTNTIDITGQETGWKINGLPENITILDLLAAVGNVNKTEMQIGIVGDREMNLFVNPAKLGLMLNTYNASFEINGSGTTVHEPKDAKELRFLRGIMDELWAATLAGLVHKMMITK